VGDKLPSDDHPTGITHRDTLQMNWSHGHNSTIHNGISRIGFYTGGHAARFRDEDLTDKWLEQSNQWIEANKDTPFFLFFASHDLHVPRVVHERFQGQTALGPRGDAIFELDWCVGQLMETLDRLQLTENTLIVFCSDNGPVLDDGYQDDAIEKLGQHKPAGPFRGGKYNVFEGGTRTPFITRWTGRIAAAVSDEMVCTIDLVASCASLAGADLPSDACLDSLDLSAALLGEAGGRGRDHLVQQDNGAGGNFGFRVGQWKLLRHDSKKTNNTELRLEPRPIEPVLLYNLETDPGESKNVIDAHPEIAKEMQEQLQALIAAGRSR
jgi:arylsulfatase A-like enzyme